MNNRMKLMQFTFEDSDEEVPKSLPGIIPFPNRPRDQFQSTSVTRGLFFNQDEGFEYENIPALKIQKNPSMITNIKMLREIDYQDEEEDVENIDKIEIKQKENDYLSPTEKDDSIAQQKKERKEEEKEKGSIYTPASRHKMLQITLSDDSDLDTEGQEGDEGDKESENTRPPLVKGAIDIWRRDEILQGQSDPKSYLRQFCTKEVNNNKVIQLSIIRKSSGINKFWPEFDVSFCEGAPFFLFAKKMMGSSTSNYYITAEPGVQSISHPNFIAKMRANFTGSLYQVFDNGVNPQKASNTNKARSILATIKFKSQLLSMEPRSFEVFILRQGVQYSQLEGFMPLKEISLDVLYEIKGNQGKIVRFVNRKPIYSQAFEGYILNFGGRGQKPSVKNFILQQQDEHREVLMLGKSSDDFFRMDVSYPMPPHVALCVSLANFDSKFLND